ncbi:P-loop containing nucleoside triphosphate hydrolase protein [Naematelia encephala]|uniref:p-loop containing nucleoside triphosphate hydrolase protein n=1 Tax=Naematelia encephala TaxID=71784 RepID=A0A1Y2AFY3_9TREE|nr:P-loop containing nucleoside triphosphate hydrolase protein [Naematelia encephala]
MSGGNIKVVVRCRPLNTRGWFIFLPAKAESTGADAGVILELARGAKGLIRMEGQQTILQPPEIVAGSSRATEKRTMTFSFDKSYWSAGPRDEPNYASQQTLYEDLGVELLDHSFEGFNTCIFAYGQTDSMMGYGADKGIIPLTTSELFRRVEERSTKEANLSYTVEVSYIEIYNEKVRDLLNPKNKGNLRVREHPSLGPYVEDLSRLVVEDYGQMITLMDEGNKARTVASTNMNETSSRSHAVFTLILTQKRHDPQTNMTGEKVSKISLVDLAGSERQASTGATGTRLREGANINKSLTTLGIVIAALAQASAETKGRKKKDDFVPYRDSVLTWLLKESLGGNSKTAMIAAISPADYEETLSTLRYADAAKKIKTHAVVNEDPNAKLIRELKEELEILRSRVASSGGIDEADFDPSIPPETQIVTYKTKDGEIRKVTKLELQDQLEASEKLMEGLNLTWEQKMAKTQAIHVEREKALEELGISVDKGIVGVHAPQKHPSLVNLNEDPLMSECLVYQLKPGATIAGSPDGDTAHIRLSGSHILPEHCIFTNEDGVVSVEAMPDARTFVNGKRVPPKMPVKLLNGFRVILGDFHVFRYNDPAAVRAERQKMRESKSMDNFPSLEITGSRPDSPARVGDGDLMDWSAARREVADIEKLGDQDLDRLFDDIIKVRTQRKRPESRPDLAAELESRFITTSQTEDSLDTYANPWAPAQGTTMTSISINTPVLLESDRLEPVIASERTVPEPDLEVTYDPKAEDAALEQQHMTKQLKTLAQEVKRMRSQAAAAKALEDVTFEPAAWTARELRLVRHAVDKWRNLRSYKIAEEILTLAVSVREANVNAREMKKPVSYNLLVVNGEAASSTSALDNLTGIVEFENVSSPAGLTGGPCTLIKVIDYPAKAVYCWDLPRFQQQLSKMRHVRTLASKPAYSQHFRVDATFSDDPPPSLSFVGSARAPLRLLANQLSYTVTVPIMCSYTMEAIGSCRVDFKCSVPSSSGVATPESGGYPLLSPITPGSRLAFSLSVDAVKGLSSVDFAAVHAQTRLSSLVGPDIASEDTFTSALIDLTKSSVAHLSLKRSVTVNVTPEIISHLRDSYVSIDLFARVRPEYLERLERFDRSRETSPSSARPSTPPRPAEDKPGMRRCETEFVGTEYHDILASIQILELSSNGDYLPAEVLDEKFQLHQGVQRRLDITLTHSSGKSLPWLKLDHVSTSGLRAVGKAGDVTSTSNTEPTVPPL